MSVTVTLSFKNSHFISLVTTSLRPRNIIASSYSNCKFPATFAYVTLFKSLNILHNSLLFRMQGTPEPPQPKLHDWNILPKKRKKSLPKICKKESEHNVSSNDTFFNGVTWTVWDLAKAGSLLSNPPKNVTFEDEQEMRVVYSLIYDVYRCK